MDGSGRGEIIAGIQRDQTVCGYPYMEREVCEL